MPDPQGPKTQGRKIRVGVLFGGRSSEHEVSLASGRAIMAHLDPGRHEAMPILVTPEGRWLLLPEPCSTPSEGREVYFPPTPGDALLVSADGGEPAGVDVFFPIIHGSHGEDGTLQGLFELAEAPFVGSGCLSSAASMDKAAAKAILRAAGLPLLPSITITGERWKAEREAVLEETEADIGYPLFVKPSSTGSSVGIHRVEAAAGLADAVEDALSYDFKVLIEEEAHGREFECAVLEDPEGDEPLATPLAEILPREGWYDYEAKYTPGKTEVVIPADLDEGVMSQMQAQARTAFAALGCSGLARVDFFYRESRGEIYINELNTLPGFTELSGYPNMIGEAGIAYPAMLERLIACAFARHARSQARLFRREG
ncbi:MAG: D-alanine--D-alanine ligase family protein [Nitrospinota bacterium]|jgi:D-alanine-D-alanine ligase|nr:D-alanine--D-alanine ligase family protein [Nitrospinota bacterium]